MNRAPAYAECRELIAKPGLAPDLTPPTTDQETKEYRWVQEDSFAEGSYDETHQYHHTLTGDGHGMYWCRGGCADGIRLVKCLA